MRTTLDIEDDVLQAAKELAAKEGSTAGAVLSRLARQGLARDSESTTRSVRVRNGIRMLPRRGEVVTLSHVQRLMEAESL